MILKLIGLVASIILVGATAGAWRDSVTATTHKEISEKGKFVVFTVFLCYALAAYLLGLTPIGWIAALIMAVMAVIATGYFATRDFPFLKVSLWVQLTLAIVAALAAGVSSVAGLKDFFGDYLLFALILAAFTVAADRFLKPSAAEKANRARQAQQAAEQAAAQQPQQSQSQQTSPTPAPAAASTPEAAPASQAAAQPAAAGGGEDPDDFERRLASAFEAVEAEAAGQPVTPAQPASPPPTPVGSSASSQNNESNFANFVGVIAVIVLLGAIAWVSVAYLAPAFGWLS